MTRLPILPLALLLLSVSCSPVTGPRTNAQLYPYARCKTLYLVRHAEGVHNQAKDNATRDKSHDPPSQVLLENVTGRKYWDARLTELGEVQCDRTRLKMLLSDTAFADPELVVVSPLTRTLQTASLVFGAGTVPFMASELCREQIRDFICEGRRNVTQLRSDFAHVDFSQIETNEDTWFYHRKEDIEAVQGRAAQFIEFLKSRQEHTIAVVTHKQFLRYMLAAFGVSDDPTVTSDFANAEMRKFQLCVSGSPEHSESNDPATTSPSNKTDVVNSTVSGNVSGDEQPAHERQEL